MTTPMLPTPPDCGSPCAMCESYAHLLAKARDEVARLREDKKRLDWLEAHGEPETFEDAPHALVWSVIGAPGERDVRVVIDAARKET